MPHGLTSDPFGSGSHAKRAALIELPNPAVEVDRPSHAPVPVAVLPWMWDGTPTDAFVDQARTARTHVWPTTS